MRPHQSARSCKKIWVSSQDRSLDCFRRLVRPHLITPKLVFLHSRRSNAPTNFLHTRDTIAKSLPLPKSAPKSKPSNTLGRNSAVVERQHRQHPEHQRENHTPKAVFARQSAHQHPEHKCENHTHPTQESLDRAHEHPPGPHVKMTMESRDFGGAKRNPDVWMAVMRLENNAVARKPFSGDAPHSRKV